MDAILTLIEELTAAGYHAQAILDAVRVRLAGERQERDKWADREERARQQKLLSANGLVEAPF